MVQGLRGTYPYSIAAILLATVALTGCSSTSTVVREYCTVAGRSHPILLSRKDSPQTKRQVVESNKTYQALCEKGTS